MITEERKEYQRQYQKKYRLANKLRERERSREHNEKIKKELREIKANMNFSCLVSEKIEEIYPNVFENNKSKNRATLHQNALGKWWYEIEYNSKREPYISGFFDKRILAIKDLKVAL